MPEAGGATGAGGETSPSSAPVTCCAPLPPSLKWACFRWAGPASPNLPPGTWRTWTLCSASSSTGQCWAGESGKRQPSVPGDEGEGRGDLSFGHLAAKSLVWDSPWGGARRGRVVGTCPPPFPESDARDSPALVAPRLAPRGTGLPIPLQRTPPSLEEIEQLSKAVF